MKYQSLIQSNTETDIGLLMTFPLQQISLDFEAQMPLKCVIFELALKQSTNNKHQKRIDFYERKHASGIYMSA